ncbi:nucleolar protein 10-like [Papaver somniferum]|uniref:nucleolar protein 10-like n=1 Tax=Papaver somniferum TaxID=3469 RepID=UPI000E6F71D1|nr:nucleolar protein 10-like [Papaver somniferum]
MGMNVKVGNYGFGEEGTWRDRDEAKEWVISKAKEKMCVIVQIKHVDFKRMEMVCERAGKKGESHKGHESTTDYLEWYERFSHPRVIWIDPPGTRRSNKASSSASTSDTRDDSTILNLVRERMKILIKEFCCTSDKGEVVEPERHRKYAEYCSHIENPQVKKMFANLAKQIKRPRKTREQLRQERAQHAEASQGGGSQGKEIPEETEDVDSQIASQGRRKRSRTSAGEGSQGGRDGGGGRGGGGGRRRGGGRGRGGGRTVE